VDDQPARKPSISITDLFMYVVGPAALAGVAIVQNPTWPVVIGILGICVLVVLVFFLVLKRESSDRGHEQDVSAPISAPASDRK
jgi:hypothetical protein